MAKPESTTEPTAAATTVATTETDAAAKTRNRKSDDDILAVLKKDVPESVDEKVDRMIELKEAKSTFVKRMDSAKATFDKAKKVVGEIDKAIADVAGSFA